MMKVMDVQIKNWELKPKKNYGDGNYVEGIL